MFGLPDIKTIIENALRGLWASLCQVIYPLVANTYQLFIDIGKIMYTDSFSKVYNKISLIIGIFMVFRVIFWLIEIMVNPDNINDKEKNPGKLIQKIMITLVLLATTPTIFSYAFKLQYIIVDNETIENIISPSNIQSEGEIGRKIAAELFSNFYTINEIEGKDPSGCERYVGKEGIHHSNLLTYGKLNNLNNFCLTARYDEEKNDDGDYSQYIIDFNGVFAVGVGAIVFWMMVMYCISLGARYAQMIFLQIIAPIPIMCNLVPGKDNMFSKWVKQCTTTYLDLFIRVVIINFVLLLANIILANENNILKLAGQPGDFWIQVFLVLGLLTFGKKAPELIQELLPKSFTTKASGDFGLSLKKRTENMVGGKFAYSTLKRAPGYVAGGVVGGAVGLAMGISGGKGVGSRIAGGLSGMTKGFATGSKKGNIFKNIGDVKKNQAAHTKKLQQWRIASGKGENDPNTIGDYFSRKSAEFTKSMGFETYAEKLDRSISTGERLSSNMKSNSEHAKSKVREENTKVYIKDKKDPSKSRFMTLTQLDADVERLKETYNTFDQNKTQIIENAKKRILVGSDKKTELSNEAKSELATLSRDEKEKLLAERFMRDGDSKENAIEKARESLTDAETDVEVKQIAEEMMLETLTSKKVDEYTEQEANRMFESERQKVYDEMQDTIKLINDNEDMALFTQQAKQIAEDGSSKEMYMNTINEYNNFVKSSALSDLGLDGVTEITEDMIKNAYKEFENGNPNAMEELSSMYKTVMKSMPTKVASLKASEEYNRAKADDTFSGGK